MTKYVSTDTAHLEKCHTDEDCPHLPKEYREMNEADKRRNLVLRSVCRKESLTAKLLLAGHSP